MSTLKVLIIEDQEKVSKVIKLITEETFEELFGGCEVVLARDGQEGINQLAKDKFDLVLTDLNMPLISGNELVSKIHDLTIDTPIVVISAYPEELDKTKGDLVYIMEKPFDIDRLGKVIKIAMASELKKKSA